MIKANHWYAFEIDGKIRRILCVSASQRRFSPLTGDEFLLPAGLEPIAAWFTLSDDGAPVKCGSCQGRFAAGDMIVAQTPDGRTMILCRDATKDCVDQEWVKLAKFGGEI